MDAADPGDQDVRHPALACSVHPHQPGPPITNEPVVVAEQHHLGQRRAAVSFGGQRCHQLRVVLVAHPLVGQHPGTHRPNLLHLQRLRIGVSS